MMPGFCHIDYEKTHLSLFIPNPFEDVKRALNRQ